jgi:uncharacterized protein DUF5678
VDLRRLRTLHLPVLQPVLPLWCEQTGGPLTAREPDESLAVIQRQYAGSWIALKDGRVVEARRSPYELMMILRERDIRDVTVIRAPAEHEVELVGLG